MAESTFRVAVIGVAHMHVNELMRRFAEVDAVEMVAVADTVPDVPELNTTSHSTRAHTLRIAREEIGIPRAYDDYRELLARERPDIVIACPENNRHGEVAAAAFAHGAHVVTEKPLAASLSEALAMVRAATQAKCALMVNWPIAWVPAIRRMKELVDDGAIGQLWQVHARYGSLGPLAAGSTHPGVRGQTGALSDLEKGATWWHRAGTGGGALLDYCCYGACLSRWFFGEPAQAAFGITANVASQYGSAEDNAILTVRFQTGIAVLEATWSCVDHAMPTGPILYGTHGTLSLAGEGRDARVRLARTRGGDAELLPGSPLPTGRDSLAREMIHHVRTGEPLDEIVAPPLNLDAMAILDAGIRSARSGRMELVDNATWNIAR